MIRLLVCFIFCLMIGCGKVAQDISNQSTKSIFKAIDISIKNQDFSDYGWDLQPATNNVVTVYGHAQGLVYEKGYETIGWANAEAQYEQVGTKNTLVVMNYDRKKNIVDTSRYQQGFFRFERVATDNYNVRLNYRKIRPKYDIYSFTQYVSKDQYVFYLTMDIPSKSVQVLPYHHVVSVLYHRHIQKESYNKDTILPLSDFYAIIPTGSVTPSANIFPQNKIKSFKVKDPLFSIETPYYDALLNIVHLVKYGDEYDAINFVESRKDANVFSSAVADQFKSSIRRYFKEKPKDDQDPLSTVDSAVTENASAQ